LPVGSSAGRQALRTGIEPGELAKLFDRFYQSQRAREMKTGLGLGLYITRGLVQAHGGRIEVESPPGCGSTFRVWFPEGPPSTGASGCAP
jgi:signal transduction histidine kinase